MAIKRQGKARYLFAPKSPIKVLAETLGPFAREHCLLVKTEGVGKFRRRLQGSIHVSLHLTKSHGSDDFGSVLMKDRIVAILPALMNQPVGRLALILDKPVAVPISRLFDPADRRVYVWPDIFDQAQVTRSVVAWCCAK